MSRLRAAIQWVGHHPTVGAVVVFGVFMASGFYTVQDIIADSEAQQCVDDWELVDAMRRIGPASNEALIEAFPNSDPAKVAAVKEATARRMEQLVIDPECDLEAARRRLAD